MNAPISGPYAKSRNLENLFLQHVMNVLAPGGRAVVSVPDSMLFRMASDHKVRKALFEKFQIEKVVSLPQGAFKPYTAVKSSLLVFRNGEPLKETAW